MLSSLPIQMAASIVLDAEGMHFHMDTTYIARKCQEMHLSHKQDQ